MIKFTFFITLTFASIMVKLQAPQDKSKQWQLTRHIAVFLTSTKKKSFSLKNVLDEKNKNY